MAYNFPVADFSALGDIPKAAEEGRQRQAQQNLADLSSQFDLNSVHGLSAAAQKAFGQGLFQEGNALMSASQAKQNAQIQAARDSAYAQFVGPAMAAIMGKGGAPTAPAGGGGAAPSVPFGGASAPPPDVFSGPPGAIPGAAPAPAAPASPVVVPPSLNAPPVSKAPKDIYSENAPVSPTEQVLASAEGAPMQAPGPQLAGPPPTPDTTAAPAPAVPAWLSGATAAPVTAPATPPPVPPSGRISGEVDPAVKARIDQLAAGMVALGPRASPTQRQALSDLYKAEVAKTTWDKEEKAYHVDQADRFATGEPTQTISDWRKDQVLDIKRAEDANKLYTGRYSARGDQANTMKETLNNFTTIMTNPRFATGAPGIIDEAQKALSEVAGNLRAFGVPPILSQDAINSMTTPAALREGFAALANQSVITSLNGLGAGKSDRDVMVARSTMPSLLNTTEGNRLIVEFMQKVADRKALEAKTARDYLTTKGNKATAPGMDQAVDDAVSKFRDEGILMNKDGKLSELGQRMKDTADKANAGNTWSGLINRTLRGATGVETPPVGTASGNPGYLPTSADYYRPPGPVIGPSSGIPSEPLPYNPTEAMTGSQAGSRPPIGALSGLANLISGRAQVPPVTSQSEEDAKRMAELMKMITVQSEERAKHRFRPIVGG